ncbi:D-alanine--D-alanine ligase family protein [Streptomyces sp. NPDC002076]
MDKGKLAVIVGGPTPERRGSIVSGDTATPALRESGWDAEIVDLEAPDFLQRVTNANAAFIASHGWYAEDGKLQGLLDVLQLPYQGSGVYASSCAMFKPAANKVVQAAGVPVPAWTEVDFTTDAAVEAKRIATELAFPLFWKPSSGGGSLGSAIVNDIPELESRITAAQQDASNTSCLVSHLVVGTDISVGILEMSGELRVLPVLATTFDGGFYDYEIKHNSDLRQHSCPADIPAALQDRLAELALTAFKALKCHGVGRVDFMLDEQGEPWFLELNTLPGLSRQGNLATMAAAGGISYNALIEHIMATAFTKPGYQP